MQNVHTRCTCGHVFSRKELEIYAEISQSTEDLETLLKEHAEDIVHPYGLKTAPATKKALALGRMKLRSECCRNIILTADTL